MKNEMSKGSILLVLQPFEIFLIGCPYENLTRGHISDRFETLDDRKLLLDYLITELMSARMLKEFKPEDKIELKLVSTLLFMLKYLQLLNIYNLRLQYLFLRL